MFSPVKLFSHGSAAFGIYFGFLIALRFILPPVFPLELDTPSIDPIQEFFIVFFAGWIYRPDLVQNVLFVLVLVGGLLLTATLCSRGTHLAIICSMFFLGTFFFLYFAGKYAAPFFNANLPTTLPMLVVNAIILIITAAGWSTLLNRKYNLKTAPPPDHWTPVEVICPHCGEKYKSNPKYCAYCSTVLRE